MTVWLPLFATISAAQISQRNVLNMNFVSEFDYAFINHVKSGDLCVCPVGAAFDGTSNSAAPYSTYIDANGYPNATIPAFNSFGGGIRIPDPANTTSETYVFAFTGSGELWLSGGTGLTYTETGSSTTYDKVSNGRWSTKSGQTSTRIECTISSSASGPQNVAFQFLSTNLNSGGFVKNFEVFRKSDETRKNTGRVFRAAFLNSLAAFNPGCIRTMNWHGGNRPFGYRFENRALPSHSGYSGAGNHVASPVYASSSAMTDGVGTANQYTLAAAVPTSANAQNTPASMVHGEVVTFRNGPAMVRKTPQTVAGITKATNGNVNCIAHGFNTGDKIIHVMGQTGSQFVGMVELNYRPVQITKVDADNYTIGVNTSAFTTFANGTDSGQSTVTAYQYLTLQVGSGSDRTAYPCVEAFGNVPITAMALNTYYTAYFDKNISGQKNSSQVWVPGVWVLNQVQGGGHTAEVPMEIITALCNELNEISTKPINLWVCMPHTGLHSVDPDYSAASNYAVKSVDVILNGANGFAGLTTRAMLIVEDGNEKWNYGGVPWAQTFYNQWRGYQNYPAGGTTDNISMAMYTGVLGARDIRAAFSGNSRIKLVLPLQGAVGLSAGNANDLRINGTTPYGVFSGGAYGTPISNHDGICYADYFDAGDNYYGGTGAGSFTDDSALYAGTSPYSSPNQSQAIANFVTKVTSTASGSNAQPLSVYTNPSNPTAGLDYTYGQAMVALGKQAWQYEGGPDWRTEAGSTTWGSHVITPADSIFLTACLDSSALGTAMVAYFNARAGLAGAAMPSVYIFIGTFTGIGADGRRWSYAGPDTYASGTEGQAVLNNGPWLAMSARNGSLA